MPISVSPQDYASRWSQGLQTSGTKITQGVNAVQVAPSVNAIKNKVKMLTNFQASVNDGTWERNTAKIDLPTWRQAMLTKGVPRIAQGAINAENKMAAFASQLIPFEQSLQSTVQAMPSTTLEENIARSGAWIRGMAKFQMK